MSKIGTCMFPLHVHFCKYCSIKSVLGRIHMYVTVWVSKAYAVEWWHRPTYCACSSTSTNHSYVDYIFRLHSDLTHACTCSCVVAGVLHSA